MGSNSSKTSSSSSSHRCCGYRGARSLLKPPCLGSPPRRSHHTVSQLQNKVTSRRTPHAVQNKTDSDDIRIECSTDVEKSDELPCVSPSVQLDQWDQGSISDVDSRTNGRSVRVSSSRPRNSPNRFLSRFNLVPRNISFRRSKTTNLGSLRSFNISSPDQRVLTDEEELHLHTRQGRGFFEGSQVQLDSPMIPARPGLRDSHSARLEVDMDSHPPRTQTRIDTIETRHSGWTGAQEHNERNVRLSRTLSVGRLRDRVLRHSSLPDLPLSPLRQETETRGAGQVSGRHVRHGDTAAPAPGVTNVSSSLSPGYASSSFPSSFVGTRDYQMQTARSTESSYHELMEYRSDFFERRRRIRSQVRALRRLGSRFESLSGHTRSCILSGQHRTGSCTCHLRSHDANVNNDPNTRSSISRIVVLAETLFEVLDEIHQQSVVLSSRPSISSIGSVPAPNEVVESLPLKSYRRVQKYKTEETAQCYICLLDYEEGDKLRTLPCQHEFHRACVDKWLKEMHRVCPVCRGDVCRSNSLPLGM